MKRFFIQILCLMGKHDWSHWPSAKVCMHCNTVRNFVPVQFRPHGDKERSEMIGRFLCWIGRHKWFPIPCGRKCLRCTKSERYKTGVEPDQPWPRK